MPLALARLLSLPKLCRYQARLHRGIVVPQFKTRFVGDYIGVSRENKIKSTNSLLTTMDKIANVQGDALIVKIITMVCLFSISMVFGCLPLIISLKFDWFKSSGPDLRNSNRCVMGLLAFGGGVLFATTFLHLLPEVDDNIKLLQAAGDLPKFHIYMAALIMCCGFFMMYLIEELVHLYINRREYKTKEENFSRALSIRKKSADADVEMKNHNHNHGGHSHIPLDAASDSIVSALRGLLIVLALSIHELFEGLAVGLESSPKNVWYMFGAVSAHKYIIGFCIGVELIAAGTKRWLSIIYIFTYSFVSALGIGVGILLVGGAGAAAAGIYSVVLQGIACGTLVYVIFFEVWRQESTGLLHLLCSAVGFTLMVSLELIVNLSAA